MDNNTKYMNIAIREAKKAYEKEELPIGAVIVISDKVYKAHNKRHQSNMVIDHAEIIAINKANKDINNWRLLNATMYITLEPCPMCASAIVQARIKKLVIGTETHNKEEQSITREIFKNGNIELEYGVMKEESQELLQTFFTNKR